MYKASNYGERYRKNLIDLNIGLMCRPINYYNVNFKKYEVLRVKGSLSPSPQSPYPFDLGSRTHTAFRKD